MGCKEREGPVQELAQAAIIELFPTLGFKKLIRESHGEKAALKRVETCS